MSKKIIGLAGLILIIFFTFIMDVIFAEEKVAQEDREITFVSNGYTLYGTLSIPRHEKTEKLPTILLVHGSGPNDRDETLDAGNGIKLKPFKEIAEYLQKKGYIVLRYDKRSFTMLQKGYSKEEFDGVLPDDFIDDARAAIDFLNTLPEVDQSRVILVGHSQGASFAPIIAKGKNLAGVVLLAPGLLPIREQMIYQLEYQIEYMKNINQLGQFTQSINQVQQILDQLKSAFEMADNGTFPEGGVIMGATLPFFKRWEELTIDIPQQIMDMEVPVLIINGTTDMLCPAEVLKEREPLFRAKSDLQIFYVPNMVHQLYYMGSTMFAEQVPEKIDEWVNKLPGFLNEGI